MRKFFLSSLFATSSIVCAYAQEPQPKKGVTEFTLGAMVQVTGTYAIKKEHPDTAGIEGWVAVGLAGDKFYLSAIYGAFDKTIKTQDGYIFPKQWNIYVLGSYGLKGLHDKYLAVGGEKSYYYGKNDNLETTFFVEAGYSVNEEEKYFSFTGGVVFYPKAFLWRKK